MDKMKRERPRLRARILKLKESFSQSGVKFTSVDIYGEVLRENEHPHQRAVTKLRCYKGLHN